MEWLYKVLTVRLVMTCLRPKLMDPKNSAVGWCGEVFHTHTYSRLRKSSSNNSLRGEKKEIELNWKLKRLETCISFFKDIWWFIHVCVFLRYKAQIYFVAYMLVLSLQIDWLLIFSFFAGMSKNKSIDISSLFIYENNHSFKGYLLTLEDQRSSRLC